MEKMCKERRQLDFFHIDRMLQIIQHVSNILHVLKFYQVQLKPVYLNFANKTIIQQPGLFDKIFL